MNYLTFEALLELRQRSEWGEKLIECLQINDEGLRLIHELRPKSDTAEKIFDSLSTKDKNRLWNILTGFEKEDSKDE